MGKSNKKVVGKAIVEIEITQDDVENIIVNSLEVGSSYWLGLNNSTPEWDEKPKGVPLSMWAAKLLLDGNFIQLYDIEDNDETFKLNLEKLIAGISIYAKEHHGGVDKERWDGESADCIVQYALFGKLVYG
ncbi:hypothetical protein P8891_05660 [Bacillus atrophaeus]|uniref:hypothetical protein n=1 Tax=Bacillus atrophaeus TaxID=1452 RepID=UPI00227FFCAF|nr:hypothetical protein [Bacillus atrophaeus]MCY7947957.1 hypothetical protein [Bacillus atrophaeus]MCY8098244.1 hypothetical protein [Bacillus atrophaeus]MCY9170021.1 hypothetical protein [Bacillus atrophaeus]MEC0740574.1 hypothetical protein [Bacillus atrophaeus]MEC0746990.1 hypothetical protein [Bacillus atrophaeus]